MQILNPVIGTGVTPSGYGYTRQVRHRVRQRVVYLQRISKVPGMHAGKSCMGWQMVDNL